MWRGKDFEKVKILKSKDSTSTCRYVPVLYSYMLSLGAIQRAPYRQREKKAFRLLNKSDNLTNLFGYSTNAKHPLTLQEKPSFWLSAETNVTLNKLRLHTFTTAVARCPIQKPVQMAAHPPSSAAA